MSKYPTIPCENSYKALLETNPDLLVEWVESDPGATIRDIAHRRSW